jgi:glucan-binding YG repeat protein
MSIRVLLKRLVFKRQALFAAGVCAFVAITFSGVLSAADKLPKSERKQSAPTMAKFYKLDGRGRSTSDSVTVPTLSNPKTEKPAPVKQPASESKQKAKPKDSSKKVNITINRDKNKYNRQDEWQCERSGFYYTKDGRCVVPAPAKRVSKPDFR